MITAHSVFLKFGKAFGIKETILFLAYTRELHTLHEREAPKSRKRKKVERMYDTYSCMNSGEKMMSQQLRVESATHKNTMKCGQSFSHLNITHSLSEKEV